MMSSASWAEYGQLDKWTDRARSSRMLFELDHEKDLSKIVARDLKLQASSRLMKEFHSASSPEDSNTALWEEWGKLAQEAGAKDPTFFERSTLRGAPFEYPLMAMRTRCRRCRTLFRYEVLDEPYDFSQGPWKDLSSCAEMLAETECKRWKLY
jgi:hypothetical protein